MDSLFSELLMNHVLPRLNTRYLAAHLAFVNKHYHSVCTKYLRGKKISTEDEYNSWLLSFLDKMEHVDIPDEIDEMEEVVVASGNINHIELSKDTCKYAAKYGHLHVIKWALKNKCKWDDRIYDRAVRFGHLHILQWLREIGHGPDKLLCLRAAKHGHLHILQWARELGYPWIGKVSSYAAHGGHIHILRWIRENGCPWDDRTCEYLPQSKSAEVLQWVIDNGCP
jgi:hypothetical protein